MERGKAWYPPELGCPVKQRKVRVNIETLKCEECGSQMYAEDVIDGQFHICLWNFGNQAGTGGGEHNGKA